MEKSIGKARKNMESKDRKKEAENKRNMAPRAGAPLRTITQYPGSHSGGFCPHRAAARLTRATARSKVNSSINTDRETTRTFGTGLIPAIRPLDRMGSVSCVTTIHNWD
ncbi:hypothetical protein PIB30_055003 [Stylosanthes scabra]|uniref:Uncharacterized protein n=1 Tax=Stylosanthes scabra TaxID=79078 RepID=A0ABU6YGC9_9FABA|nr:hypothetical protein [Stylosanthes scabra]